MSAGFDWLVIGQAAVAIVVLGVLLQGATLFAFRRLTN
jgi:hypothetical protein